MRYTKQTERRLIYLADMFGLKPRNLIWWFTSFFAAWWM